MNVYADVLTTAHSWNSEEPLLTYSVPSDMQHELQLGQLIAVPYGDRVVEGIVWRIWEEDSKPQRDTAGDHKGPPNPTSSTLAPTDADGLFLVAGRPTFNNLPM